MTENTHDVSGWKWFDRKKPSSPDDLAIAFARCFSTDDGRRVLHYLKDTTLHRALGANVMDTQLYYQEGQRALVTGILHLINRGRAPHSL